MTEAQLTATYVVIDKIERQPPEKTLKRLTEEVGLDETVALGIQKLFATPTLQAVREGFGGAEAVAVELDRMDSYLGMLQAMGLGDFVDFDLTIVRGLAYYTGIVFEIFDRQGELRAVCGGGRYDRLLELVGGEPLPAVGFGMGDVVLTELLKEKGLLPDVQRSVDYFLVPIGDDTPQLARSLAHRLRDQGHSVSYALRGIAVRKQFRAAETEGAREVVVLGPDEVARGVAVVRDMATGQEREVALDDLGAGESQ